MFAPPPGKGCRTHGGCLDHSVGADGYCKDAACAGKNCPLFNHRPGENDGSGSFFSAMKTLSSTTWVKNAVASQSAERATKKGVDPSELKRRGHQAFLFYTSKYSVLTLDMLSVLSSSYFADLEIDTALKVLTLMPHCPTSLDSELLNRLVSDPLEGVTNDPPEVVCGSDEYHEYLNLHACYSLIYLLWYCAVQLHEDDTFTPTVELQDHFAFYLGLHYQNELVLMERANQRQ
eukprot:TRINITY_DN86624_c0_g1_i1.p1 TRINITY_DN86624_c0_g1~~TRINITY_DN86624_c0_g1_i1.p1  ORF type:complete len:245 (+),score=8.21 TRINITY_DN86624_c0_g1_i1:39-737(+)